MNSSSIPDDGDSSSGVYSSLVVRYTRVYMKCTHFLLCVCVCVYFVCSFSRLCILRVFKFSNCNHDGLRCACLRRTMEWMGAAQPSEPVGAQGVAARRMIHRMIGAGVEIRDMRTATSPCWFFHAASCPTRGSSRARPEPHRRSASSSTTAPPPCRRHHPASDVM